MDLEFKTEQEVMEFFHNRHGFMPVHRICELLITHQNVQADEIIEIKRHLHRLKEREFLLVQNEGEDIYQERFASTAERVERYFTPQRVDEFTQMLDEELLQIIRRNENPNVPGSRHQRATQELALRDRERNQRTEGTPRSRWWEKTWVQIIMLAGAIAGVVGLIFFFI